VSALALFACLASELASQGQTLSKYLDSLYDKYGHFVNLNSYWICRDSTKTARLFNEVRHSGLGGNYPTTLGQWPISHLKDITEGYDSAEQDKKLRCLPVDKSGQMLSFELDTAAVVETGLDGLRGTLRSSGTEPKIKFYLEGWGADKKVVGAALARVRDALASEWMKVEVEGLESP
jgi:phosphoglucomutase